MHHMITLRSTEFLVGLITFILVYFFSTTIAGAFRAWVAKKMGDDTAEQAGFLSLNPFVHMDFVGFAFLCLTYFGWSRLIPINPYNIDGRINSLGIKHGWRIPKLLLAYLSDSLAYFFMAFISLIILVALFGANILYIAPSMLVHPSCISHLTLAHAFPHHTSLTIVFGFILIVLAYLSIVLGVLDAILNICHMVLALIAERSPEFVMHYGYLTILIPIVLIFCCASRLRLLVTGIMLYGGWILARLFGLL